MAISVRSLAAKTWTHPVTERDIPFSAVTIERWYYAARQAKHDPVGVLRRAVRKDCGKVSLPPAVDAETTHLEVIAELHDEQRRSLQEQVLKRLASGVVLIQPVEHRGVEVRTIRVVDLQWAARD